MIFSTKCYLVSHMVRWILQRFANLLPVFRVPFRVPYFIHVLIKAMLKLKKKVIYVFLYIYKNYSLIICFNVYLGQSFGVVHFQLSGYRLQRIGLNLAQKQVTKRDYVNSPPPPNPPKDNYEHWLNVNLVYFVTKYSVYHYNIYCRC
jgi:hypothetical protein